MQRILIVEDEQALSAGLKFNFEQEGYQVLLAGDGPTAIALCESADPPIDMMILDLMLPGMSGYEICKAIRHDRRDLPILVLSARNLSEDKSLAFDSGTDQYMTKPFALPELLSRVRNLLERRPGRTMQEKNANDAEDVYQIGDVHVDLARFEVRNNDGATPLTTLETQLLRYFLKHPHQVLSRAQILKDVWGEQEEISSRSIDNFVLRLRKMIEADPSKPKHIVAVRGTGYRFMP